jgi:hypothetical protein
MKWRTPKVEEVRTAEEVLQEALEHGDVVKVPSSEEAQEAIDRGDAETLRRYLQVYPNRVLLELARALDAKGDTEWTLKFERRATTGRPKAAIDRRLLDAEVYHAVMNRRQVTGGRPVDKVVFYQVAQDLNVTPRRVRDAYARVRKSLE